MAPFYRLARTAFHNIWLQLITTGVRRWSSFSWRLKLLAFIVLTGGLALLILLARASLIQPQQERLLPEPNLSLAERREVAARFSILDFDSSQRPLGLPVVKRIHFMYKGYKVDPHFQSLLSSWRKIYPDYRMYFWTDAEIDLLISRIYPAWQDMYRCQLSNYMERSDTARAFVLHAMGGWYADLDTGCLSRADGLAARHALILPLEPYLHAVSTFHMRRMVSNAIMYSAPHHPFWMFYLNRLRDSRVGKKPRDNTNFAVFTTGPVLLTEVALKFQQANNGAGCPGPWCPHLPPPVQFLPVYDNETVELRDRFRLLCNRKLVALQPDIPEFYSECSRFAPYDFANHPLDPTVSYSFHLFVHLNQRKERRGPTVDVRQLGLNFVHSRDLVAEVKRLL